VRALWTPYVATSLRATKHPPTHTHRCTLTCRMPRRRGEVVLSLPDAGADPIMSQAVAPHSLCQPSCPQSHHMHAAQFLIATLVPPCAPLCVHAADAYEGSSTGRSLSAVAGLGEVDARMTSDTAALADDLAALYAGLFKPVVRGRPPRPACADSLWLECEAATLARP
jgi:hypothetical protein